MSLSKYMTKMHLQSLFYLQETSLGVEIVMSVYRYKNLQYSHGLSSLAKHYKATASTGDQIHVAVVPWQPDKGRPAEVIVPA